MGQASVQTSISPAAKSDQAVRVIDVVKIDPKLGLSASGFVLVLEDFRPAEPTSLVGQSMVIQLQEGWTLTGEIAGVRDHGTTVSVLLKNWPDQFPRPAIDWRVTFPGLVLDSNS